MTCISTKSRMEGLYVGDIATSSCRHATDSISLESNWIGMKRCQPDGKEASFRPLIGMTLHRAYLLVENITSPNLWRARQWAN